jgi:hypothetical protein
MAFKQAKTIIIETNYWKFAASSVPIIALGTIFFVYFIGWDDLFDKLVTIGSISFFAIAVFWWWWAISKISQFSKMISDSTDKMDDIKQELVAIRKENDSYR